jgi:thiol-disulfide isomerase/thioredoxin
MRHPFRWIALGVGAVIAVFAVILAVNVGTDPRADLNQSTLVGKSAPELRLTRLDGTKVVSADLAGKTVLVNFWNTWCRPCAQELPALQQWYAQHRNDPDVLLLGVPRDEPSGKSLRDAAKADGMDWVVADDGGAEAATLDFGTRGQPETYVISPSGVVAGSYFGPATVKILDQMVAGGQQVG